MILVVSWKWLPTTKEKAKSKNVGNGNGRIRETIRRSDYEQECLGTSTSRSPTEYAVTAILLAKLTIVVLVAITLMRK